MYISVICQHEHGSLGTSNDNNVSMQFCLWIYIYLTFLSVSKVVFAHGRADLLFFFSKRKRIKVAVCYLGL